MVITRFPDPRRSTSEGIVAVGGDLEPESLLLAYSQGIFPWPIPELPLTWFCPPERAILEWDQLHISRSLAKIQKKTSWTFTVDRAFHEVILECSKRPRPGQTGTWITEEMTEAYRQLHRLGHAHSIEVWKENQLVGGIYGVDAGGAFAGESMFYLEPNASKLAILYLMQHLHTRGLDWMDIQVLTPHLQALGAREIPRNSFLEKLRLTRTLGIQLF